ncbi:MAG: asparagine synthase (glutamine-hydrolyzing) [Deltaproteobacteria bacterium]|nr:asparagine synthase (glutamine-hydrolyzing) [Deltaproteobacteria bacterium]
MCGVLAVFDHRGGISRFEQSFHRALATLAPRGPDGEGQWRSPDGRCLLGHRRLAMRGGVGGHQPLLSHDGQLAAVVNGELYRCVRPLSQSLGLSVEQIRTQSDSALVLLGYERFGDAVATELDGELAAVLYDTRAARLVAMRDPFGIKPLHYAWIDGALAIASEAKALFALGAHAAWSPEALAMSLWFQYPPHDHSLFRDVSVVPPGALVSCTRGELTVHRELVASRVRTDEHELTLGEDPVASVRAALSQAISLRLDAEVPLGFYLSGGLDSSAVLSCAVREHGATGPAFTLQFDDENYDESAIASRFARALGVSWHAVSVSRLSMVDSLADAAIASEGLAINGHLVARHRLAQACAHAGIKGVLMGEGADELFYGYAHLVADFAGNQNDDSALRSRFATSASVMLGDREDPGLASLAAQWGHVPAWVAAKLSLGRRITALVRPELHEALSLSRASSSLTHALQDLRPSGDSLDHRLKFSSRSWSRLALSGYILRTLGDGADMRFGVEGRLPMLDPVVAALADSIAPTRHLRGGIEKQLLRAVVAPWVGEEIANRPKKPLLAPALLAHTGAHDAVQQALRATQGLPSWACPEATHRWLDSVARCDPRERVAHDPTASVLLSAAALERGYRFAIAL